MKWCENDCHANPIWCGCKTCLNRGDYSKAWKKRNEVKETRYDNTSDNSELKIALAAMTSPEDFAVLQE